MLNRSPIWVLVDITPAPTTSDDFSERTPRDPRVPFQFGTVRSDPRLETSLGSMLPPQRAPGGDAFPAPAFKGKQPLQVGNLGRRGGGEERRGGEGGEGGGGRGGRDMTTTVHRECWLGALETAWQDSWNITQGSLQPRGEVASLQYTCQLPSQEAKGCNSQ